MTNIGDAYTYVSGSGYILKSDNAVGDLENIRLCTYENTPANFPWNGVGELILDIEFSFGNNMSSSLYGNPFAIDYSLNGTTYSFAVHFQGYDMRRSYVGAPTVTLSPNTSYQVRMIMDMSNLRHALYYKTVNASDYTLIEDSSFGQYEIYSGQSKVVQITNSLNTGSGSQAFMNTDLTKVKLTANGNIIFSRDSASVTPIPKIGSSDISKIYLGTEEISKIYLGSELVYEATSIHDVPSTVSFIRNEDLENALGLPLQPGNDFVIPTTVLTDFKSVPVRQKVYDNNYRLVSDTTVNGVPDSNSDEEIDPYISHSFRHSDASDVSQSIYFPVFYAHHTYPNSSPQGWYTCIIETPIHSTLQELENAIDNEEIEDEEGDAITRNSIAFIVKGYWDSDERDLGYHEIYLSSNVVYTPSDSP